jgi:hypothetical protein
MPPGWLRAKPYRNDHAAMIVVGIVAGIVVIALFAYVVGLWDGYRERVKVLRDLWYFRRWFKDETE